MYDQFEDRRVGLRFCTFVTPVQDLGGGCKVMAPCIPPPWPSAHMQRHYWQEEQQRLL